MKQVTFSLSLTVSFNPDEDDPPSLVTSLEEIIGIWCPLGATGYVKMFTIAAPYPITPANTFPSAYVVPKRLSAHVLQNGPL